MFEKHVGERVNQDKAADDEMLNRVYMVMSQKLAQKRAEGYGGWHDPDQCSIEDLKQMLIDHLDKGDWVDILNFAGMIYVRTEMEKWK
jgi:hypothetical protein